MATETLDIKTYVLRFLRTYIPQAVVTFPVIIIYAKQIEKVLPTWVIPVLVFMAAVVTTLDKLLRDLKVY